MPKSSRSSVGEKAPSTNWGKATIWSASAAMASAMAAQKRGPGEIVRVWSPKANHTLRSHIQLPIAIQRSPLDFLFAQEKVQCCGNSIRALAKSFREIALADDHVSGWVALVDIASVG